MKIAAWSGPRNLSTAMMYSFAARGDCAVWDEPFYAPYLAQGPDHPMREVILAAHETNPSKVAAACAGPIPEGRTHWYMKHMPHHMVEGMPLSWTNGCVHLHLIRHPARVIASYAAKRTQITLEDIGFAQQAVLFDRLGGVVIDTTVLRRNPRAMLQNLCAEIGLPWTDKMLKWAAGPKPYDGVWAAHWYNAVHQSTGFAAAEGPLPEVPGKWQGLLAQALPFYEVMRARVVS